MFEFNYDIFLDYIFIYYIYLIKKYKTKCIFNFNNTEINDIIYIFKRKENINLKLVSNHI